MSRTFATGRMLLTVALVDRHLLAAGLEHRARFVASGDDMGDDRIDIVEIEGGVTVSIRLTGGRYGVNRYDRGDDGEIEASEDCGLYATPCEAAACVVEVLKRADPASPPLPSGPIVGSRRKARR